MPKKKKPKLKKRPFHVWRPSRPTQKPDPRRCRHMVTRTTATGTRQCPRRAEVFFTDEKTGERLGACMEHNPFDVNKLSEKQSKSRVATGRVDSYNARLAKYREAVTVAAIAWARSGYESKAAEKMRKAADRYLAHEAKGEPK